MTATVARTGKRSALAQLPGTEIFLRDLYHALSQGEQERLQLGVDS